MYKKKLFFGDETIDFFLKKTVLHSYMEETPVTLYDVVQINKSTIVIFLWNNLPNIREVTHFTTFIILRHGLSIPVL